MWRFWGKYFSAASLNKSLQENLSFVVGSGGDDFVKNCGVSWAPAHFTKWYQPPPTTNYSICRKCICSRVQLKTNLTKTSHNDSVDKFCHLLISVLVLNFENHLETQKRPRPKYDVPDLENCVPPPKMATPQQNILARLANENYGTNCLWNQHWSQVTSSPFRWSTSRPPSQLFLYLDFQWHFELQHIHSMLPVDPCYTAF